MASVQELLRHTEGLPGDSPRRDLEVLLGYCLGKPRTWLYSWPEAQVAPDQASHFQQLVDRRRGGTPVAYLTGRREFWSLELEVNCHTLIPRPETETLVAWALALALPANASVLDLGTGSGAIALALASEQAQWQLLAVDASEAALRVARNNSRRAGLGGVQFLCSDWYRALGARRFHLVVGNPPYVDGEDPHLQQGDVKFEPRSALVAAAQGLADLQTLVSAAPAHLHPGGWLLLEHGYQQGAAVREMFRAAGFEQVSTRADLAGLERVSGGCRHAE